MLCHWSSWISVAWLPPNLRRDPVLRLVDWSEQSCFDHAPQILDTWIGLKTRLKTRLKHTIVVCHHNFAA